MINITKENIIEEKINGGLAERLIAPVLKTGGLSGSVGSNPTPSSKWKSPMDRG